MKCPFCTKLHKKVDTEVINSRKGKSDQEVWRRRKCLYCNEIFTTTETFSYDSWFVVKRNLTRKRFIYEKLFSSILHSTEGGKGSDRGDEALYAKKVTKMVIDEIFNFKNSYFSTKDIIRITHSILVKEDQFFAQRYAMYSAYRLKTISNDS